MSRRLVLLALCALLLPLAISAQLTLTVSPSSVDWNNTTAIRATVTGLTASETHLRMYVDADQSGTLTSGDYLAWSDVARDGVTEWSPVMYSDLDGAAHRVALDLGPLSPFRFPHTAGRFLFQAQDGSAGALSAAVPFTVTQTTGALTVSGQVQDSYLAPVAGAVVVLMPLGDNGFEGFGEDWERWGPSCVADGSGNFTLNVPAAMLEAGSCTQRLVVPIKPGYMTQLLVPNQPFVTLNASVTGVNPVLRLGEALTAASGSVTYSSGTKIGQGIPGSWVFGVSGDGPVEFTVAMTNTNGTYSMPLSAHPLNPSGAFSLNCWDPMFLALQGAVGRDDTGVSVAVGGTLVGNLAFPAANGFVQGTLLDSTGAAVGAGYLVHAKDLGCYAPTPTTCYRANGLTRTNGGFVLGVVGGTGTYQGVLLNRAYIPAGYLSVGATCVSVPVAAWPAAVTQNLSLQAPTASVNGSVRDLQGDALGGLSVRGTSYPTSCQMVHTRAFTSCEDGSYSLPAAVGTWTVEMDPGELNGVYRNLDEKRASKSATLSGSLGGADFILGEWSIRPVLTEISPGAGYDGVPIQLRGTGFTVDPASTPVVTWTYLYDGTTASGTVLSWRPDLGELVVTVPDSPLGNPYDHFAVTVMNPDLGLDSNRLCYSAMGVAPATTPCAIGGTVYASDGITGLPGALVEVSGQDRVFRGWARTALNGAYSVSLPEGEGDYRVAVFPPDLTVYAPGLYASVACTGAGVTLNHTCATGSHVTGRVVDAGGDGIGRAQAEFETSAGEVVRVVTDADGNFDLRLPPATYPFARFLGPPTSRWVTARQPDVDLTLDHGFGDIALTTGAVLAGRAQTHGLYWMGDWGGVAERWAGAPRAVEAFRTSDGAFAGRANMNRAETCDGGFSIALPEGQSVRLDLSDPDSAKALTQVNSFALTWDAFADYIFPVFDVRGPATREPRFGRDLKSHGQVGEAIDVWGSHFGSAADAVMPAFMDGAGALILIGPPDSYADADRGVMVTHVPAGAALPYLDLTLYDGAEVFFSDIFPFAIDAGTFDPGSLTVSGSVTASGLPVAGVLVALLTGGAAGEDCEAGSDNLHGYAVTGADGLYSIQAVAGDITLVVFPPASTGYAAASFVQAGLSGNLVHNFALGAGNAVTVTVTDGVDPVAGARVSFKGTNGGFIDTRLTDASGVANLPLPTGSYGVEVLGPEGDRFLEHTETRTISAPLGFSVALARGVMATARAVDQAGAPVPICSAYTQDPADSNTEYGFGFTGDDGQSSLPAPASQSFAWGFKPREAILGDYSSTEGALTADTVKHPSTLLAPAGVIAGTVTQYGTSTGLGNIRVRVLDGSNPTQEIRSTRTCADGSYRIKLDAGTNYLVSFNEGGVGEASDSYATEYYSESYCSGVFNGVTVTEGGTTTVDEALNPGAPVSGTVWNSAHSPLSGATASIAGTPLGTCTLTQSTDSTGAFRLRVPTGSVRAWASSPGYPDQCWDHYNGCSLYTPLTLTQGAAVTGVDFDLGSVPEEVPATGTGAMKMMKTAVSGQVKITFTKVSGAESYSVYVWSGYNTSLAPLATYCHLVPGVDANFVDNGDGTVSYTFTPSASVRSFLVTASNTVAEGTLGYKRPTAERDSPPSSWRCWNNARTNP